MTTAPLTAARPAGDNRTFAILCFNDAGATGSLIQASLLLSLFVSLSSPLPASVAFNTADASQRIHEIFSS